ncbi:MAG: hypothetical protein RRY73_06415, partial [Alistipes sp.]
RTPHFECGTIDHSATSPLLFRSNTTLLDQFGLANIDIFSNIGNEKGKNLYGGMIFCRIFKIFVPLIQIYPCNKCGTIFVDINKK